LKFLNDAGIETLRRHYSICHSQAGRLPRGGKKARKARRLATAEYNAAACIFSSMFPELETRIGKSVTFIAKVMEWDAAH